MNKFVFSALAATLVGATGFASETEWPELDREIEALHSTLSAQSGGPSFDGWVIPVYENVSDLDVGGFGFDSARLRAQGSNGDYGYRVEVELRSGTAELLDAYGTFNIGSNVQGQFGQFRTPFLTSSLIDRNQTLFIGRSILGELFAGRDDGLQISGSMETVGWAVAVQNGTDGIADEYLISGRASVDLMGDGAGATNEGAFNAGEGNCLSAALAFADDGFLSDGSAFALEAYFTSGPFGASAELVDLDVSLGDATPFAATGSYMFNADYEAAIRYEDLDDSFDTNVITVGVNRYINGHDVKWQFNYSTVTSDISALEVDAFAIGLAVGI